MDTRGGRVRAGEAGETRSLLVTGSSTGIGRATAERFAGRGWRVFASMRHAERGAELRALAAERGWRLTTPELDVTDDNSVAAAVGAVLHETGGRLDVLVNNAGYYAFGSLEETTPAELRDQLDTNVGGVHRVTRAVLPAMRARRAGTVVTLGSVSGRVAVPMVGPYHASKWALEGMIESWRLELLPFGVRVVLVEPGPFATQLHSNERLAAHRGRRPLRRAAGQLPAAGGQDTSGGGSHAADRRHRTRWDGGQPALALAGWAYLDLRGPSARVLS
jgi:NAD(P)-dependent dehydrogenase (short-subunit alcohol dehydrogenase family)